jgi:hypothetical protein
MAVRLPPTAGAVPALSFRVEEGGVLDHAAVPTLRLALQVTARGGEAVSAAVLDVQVRIAATRRPYAAAERDRLVDVFGPVEQWGRSVRSLHWCNVPLHVGPFTGSTVVDLLLPCTYDLHVVAAARYLHALEDGVIPLELLFSGSVFHPAPDGRLQVGRLAWDDGAEYPLPVAALREAMERHFPGAAWLRLQRATFDRLWAYKARGTHLSWDAAVEALLDEAGEP